MSTNIAQVTAWLQAFVDSFDFNHTIGTKSLGRDIAHKAVQQIQDRALSHRTGAGTAWPPNSDTPTHWTEGPNGEAWGYRQWKDENYGTDEPNSRTGQMLSKESLYGRTKIEAKQITLIYGENKPPSRSYFGKQPDPKIFAQDQKVTDTFKAYLAHTGQSKKQIVRPFYILINEDGVVVAEVAREQLADYINFVNAQTAASP
jgi:hypothetical protein